VVDALSDIPGLRTEISEARPELQQPVTNNARAMIYFENDWRGPTRDQIVQKLEDGEPGIRVSASNFDGAIGVVPVNLHGDEEVVIAQRLREILTGGEN
jgi:hypothetical protein